MFREWIGYACDVSVAVALIVVLGALVGIAGAVASNAVIWQAAKDMRRHRQEVPPGAGRRLAVTFAVFAGVLAWLAAAMTAPFGIRDTVLYLIGLPVLTLVLGGVLVVGVRGYRETAKRRPRP